MNQSTENLRQKLKYALSTARGIPVISDLTRFKKNIEKVRDLNCVALSEKNLREEAARIRESNLPDGAVSEIKVAQADSPMIQFFALVAQAFRLKLGVAVFDEQLAAAMVMAGGGLAEMATGEGKTFAAAFTAAWMALKGRGVHVLTANGYLAERDAAWLSPVYEALGLRCACVVEGMEKSRRQDAYRADITYIPAREAGYDYLRDRLAMRTEDLVQRTLYCAIVDEADSILIDEARIPLVIAEKSDLSQEWLARYDRLADSLAAGEHYLIAKDRLAVSLTQEGQETVARELAIGGMHCPEDRDHFARVHAALYARCFLAKDVDYVVQGDRVELVDAFTGRKAAGRRWPFGVQASVECREGVTVQPESSVQGSISMQRFVPLYEKIAAMTATAIPSAEELHTTYGLPIYVIPPHVPMLRVDAPDCLYAAKAAKEDAVVREVCAEHAKGRPILVATASVAESEALAQRLRDE